MRRTKPPYSTTYDSLNAKELFKQQGYDKIWVKHVAEQHLFTVYGNGGLCHTAKICYENIKNVKKDKTFLNYGNDRLRGL